MVEVDIELLCQEISVALETEDTVEISKLLSGISIGLIIAFALIVNLIAGAFLGLATLVPGLVPAGFRIYLLKVNAGSAIKCQLFGHAKRTPRNKVGSTLH
ncbi:MAG: hypothetical protein GY785_24985 [Gammaproteobacteria bacterium]|nr:hypothetical protein [Gammaproteobacteria bacterium]